MHDDSLIIVTSSHLATLSSLVAFRLPEREHYGATLISPLLLKKHMTLMWMYVQHACTCVVNYVSIWYIHCISVRAEHMCVGTLFMCAWHLLYVPACVSLRVWASVSACVCSQCIDSLRCVLAWVSVCVKRQMTRLVAGWPTGEG